MAVPTVLSPITYTLAATYGLPLDNSLLSVHPINNRKIYDRLVSQGLETQNVNESSTYAELTAANFGVASASFPTGGDPPSIGMTRPVTAIPKHSYGASAGIAEVHLLASSAAYAQHSINGEPFADEAGLAGIMLMMRSVSGLDFDLVRGTTGGGTPDACDGIVTKVTQANGALLTDDSAQLFSKPNWEAHLMRQHMREIVATGVFCSAIAKNALTQAYKGDNTREVIQVNADGSTTLGIDLTSINTVMGRLPIIDSTRFPYTQAGGANTATTTIYTLTEKYETDMLLYLDWQIRFHLLGPEQMGRFVGQLTSKPFAVWGHVGFVLRGLYAMALYKGKFSVGTTDAIVDAGILDPAV